MSFHVIFFLHICCRTNRWVWGIRALNSLSCTKRNFLPPRLPAVPTWRQKSAACFTFSECFEVHCLAVTNLSWLRRSRFSWGYFAISSGSKAFLFPWRRSFRVAIRLFTHFALILSRILLQQGIISLLILRKLVSLIDPDGDPDCAGSGWRHWRGEVWKATAP